MDKQKLLEHIKNEVDYSKDFVSEKRELFRDRIRQYIEPNKDEDKVDSNIIYSALNTAVAIHYSDELKVEFAPRKFGDAEYADNLTQLAKFDYEEMGLDTINFQKEWDRHFFGVGIRKLKGWDDNRKCPIFEVKDPLSWLPDPRGSHVDEFRFNYFEEEIAKDYLTSEYGFDEEEVAKIGQDNTSDVATNRSYKNNAQGLTDPQEEGIDNSVLSVITGETVYEGKRYEVVVDSDCGILLKAEEIVPVLNEEKKDNSLVESRVIISYYSPYRGDPYGVSLVDLIVDKQKANKILMNLRLISAKFATFGQQYLYDPKAIKNINDLRKPSSNPKYIPFDSKSGVPISSALYPVPRENIMADSYNMSEEITRQIQTDTGIDSRTLGVQGEKNITLGESQQIQANANVRFGLNVAVNFWSEKKFWKLWWRTYCEYFSGSDKKFIRITSGFASVATEFRKDDFIGGSSPDVIIDSQANIDSKREKLRIAFQAQLPLIQADPSISTINKIWALRYSLMLNGVPKEMIKVVSGVTPEEAKAKNKMILIDNNDMLGAEIDSMDEDHMTYILMFENCVDTEAKTEAIRRRWEAYALTWNGAQNQYNNGAMQGIANASAAQMTNSALQSNSGWIVSTQNVA